MIHIKLYIVLVLTIAATVPGVVPRPVPTSSNASTNSPSGSHHDTPHVGSHSSTTSQPNPPQHNDGSSSHEGSHGSTSQPHLPITHSIMAPLHPMNINYMLNLKDKPIYPTSQNPAPSPPPGHSTPQSPAPSPGHSTPQSHAQAPEPAHPTPPQRPLKRSHTSTELELKEPHNSKRAKLETLVAGPLGHALSPPNALAGPSHMDNQGNRAKGDDHRGAETAATAELRHNSDLAKAHPSHHEDSHK